ncbi:hypothetical protein HID58_036859, partial [Brassica napus]
LMSQFLIECPMSQQDRPSASTTNLLPVVMNGDYYGGSSAANRGAPSSPAASSSSSSSTTSSMPSSPLRTHDLYGRNSPRSLLSGSKHYRAKSFGCYASIIKVLWRERNQRLHNGISSPPQVSFKEIDRQIRNAILARKHRRNFKNIMGIWLAHE